MPKLDFTPKAFRRAWLTLAVVALLLGSGVAQGAETSPSFERLSGQVEYLVSGWIQGLVDLWHSVSPSNLGYDIEPNGLGYDIEPNGLGYDIEPNGLGYDIEPNGLGYDIEPNGSDLGYDIEPNGLGYDIEPNG